MKVGEIRNGQNKQRTRFYKAKVDYQQKVGGMTADVLIPITKPDQLSNYLIES